MKKAQAKIEFVLIAVFVAIVLVFSWKTLAGTTYNLLDLSFVRSNSPESLMNFIKRKMSGLIQDRNDVNKRIETVGALGQLIAQCKNNGCSDELMNFLLAQLQLLDPSLSPEAAKACASNPDSCMSLMTISNFTWEPGNSEESLDINGTYFSGKVPVTLVYTNKYLNSSGVMVTETIRQTAYIQKEQLGSYSGKSYSSILNSYMSKTFPPSMFTGSASRVQGFINSDVYMGEKNCILSKSESTYVDFSGHKVYWGPTHVD